MHTKVVVPPLLPAPHYPSSEPLKTSIPTKHHQHTFPYPKISFAITYQRKIKMRIPISTLLSLISFTSLTTALPTPQSSTSDSINVTLYGATSNPADKYSLSVPFESWTYTTSFDPQSLSISRVEYDHSGTQCWFAGVNQKTAPPVESNGGQLGPPQRIYAVYCQRYGS
ncbi:hypothetical protein B0O99DRAFT_352744 [Bisporella sp. PMI_857]|nr:hypothetical protein B0O99DRAFT_352744 [Bisporella sp. PMI_857]